MEEIKFPIWGKPRVTLFGQPISYEPQATIHFDESDIKDTGVIFEIPKIPPIYFDVELDKAAMREIRKLYKKRMPRKFKKKVKEQIAKFFGLDIKKIKFSNHI